MSSVVLVSLLAGCMGGGGSDLVLHLGVMNPLTGGLSSLGPDMEAGMKLAVQQINDAHAGLRIDAIYKDDRTTDKPWVSNVFEELKAAGVTAIAGPCCSGVTGTLLPKAIENEIVVSTPSATSPDLTTGDNKGYFWRVPPNDLIQAPTLAVLIKEDNSTAVAIIAINNPYGSAFTDAFTTKFLTLGGLVTKTVKYDEGATSFSSQVDAACATPRPQGILLVGYVDEGAAILKEMQSKGCRQDVKMYGSEGIYDPQLVAGAGKDTSGNWLAAGVKGTAPDAGTTRYSSMFQTAYGHAPHLYSAHSYDAVMYVALAALKAHAVDGASIAAQLRPIANPPGEKVSDFAQAAQLIKDGKDIDYAGAAHDFEFSEKNEPTSGFYQFWRVTDAGVIETYATGKSSG